MISGEIKKAQHIFIRQNGQPLQTRSNV